MILHDVSILLQFFHLCLLNNLGVKEWHKLLRVVGLDCCDPFVRAARLNRGTGIHDEKNSWYIIVSMQMQKKARRICPTFQDP